MLLYVVMYVVLYIVHAHVSNAHKDRPQTHPRTSAPAHSQAHPKVQVGPLRAMRTEADRLTGRSPPGSERVHVKPKAQPAVFGVHARQLEVDRRTKRTAKSRVVMLVPWRACTPDDALRLRRSGSEALAGA